MSLPLSFLTHFFLLCRDASYGMCTYKLTVLDCLRGVHQVRSLFPFPEQSLLLFFASSLSRKNLSLNIPFFFLQAMLNGFLDFSKFDLEEYQFYEVKYEKIDEICREIDREMQGWIVIMRLINK